MTDLVEARRLAIKLGYLNEDGTAGPAWATASAQSIVTAQALGRPPLIAELPPSRYFNTSAEIEIDRFPLNPGESLYRQMLPGAKFAYAAPTMFATGDLPLLTACGVDPSVLKWAAWYYRHSAAMTDSRAHVLQMIEESQNDQPDPEALQIEAGRDAWQNYFTRISQWVSTPPQGQGQPSGNQTLQEQMRRLYGPGQYDEAS